MAANSRSRAESSKPNSSPLDPALREAHEEIGLSATSVEVLAALDPIDTRTTGFRIHPFLGRLASIDVPTDPSRRRNGLLDFPTW